jgi:hypothetical protein
VLCRQSCAGGSVNRARFPIAAVLAAVINLFLFGVLVWAALEGDFREVADIVAMFLALFPLLNLVALVLRRALHNKALHQTRRGGAVASRPVVEARLAGEGRC